jgi:hypothetical protein
MIASIDKKVEGEGAFRVRNEDEVRKWFEQKFNMMMERLNFEEEGTT